MNDTTSPFRKVSILLCALAVPMGLAAEDANKTRHHHYKLIDLGTLGGTQSYFSPGSGNALGQFSHVLNERGQVAGLANTALPDPFTAFCFDLEGDCLLTHAFEAHDSARLTDLGPLPGGGSSAATWISANGLIAGLSRNGEIDPSIPQFPEDHAVLWRKGEIIDLGTLPEGGSESYAAAVNSRGQVVGAAINTIPDPNSMGNFWLGPPFPFQTRAFLWEQDKGMQDLGTLPGGTDAQAILINEAGQVVGWSYSGSTPVPPNTCGAGEGVSFSLETGSFIWEKDKGMRDLGSIGGTCTVAADLNDRGQIVGSSNLAGDQSSHAFLWDNGVIHDLGGSLGGSFTGAFAINQSGRAVGVAFLPGDTIFHAALWTRIGQLTDLGGIGADQCSYATSINAHMQIVGSSISDCTFQEPNFRAFLWEESAMLDLNALIPPDSTLHLQITQTINSRGEIAGTGSDVHGNTHAFLLIPCDEGHSDVEGCDYSLVDASAATRESATSVMQKPTATAPRAPALYGPFNDVRRMFPGRLGSGRFAGGPQQVALSGAVTAISGPIVSLSPTGETFSTQPIGTTSAAKLVALKNTGTTSVTITAIAIVGTNAGDFAQTHTCGSSLAAGASCSISVRFKPTASGTRTAALSVTDTAAGSPQKVGLTGVGTTAKLSLTSLSFGAVILGTSSPAKAVTLTNVGTATLTISGIAITGTNAGDFAQTHTCGSSLAAGASCTVSVAFKPTQIGNRSGTLSVTDNAPGSPQTVSLSGTGTEVALSPTSLRFACILRSLPVPRCVCFTSRTATLTNVGRKALNISGIAISGLFSQTNSCDASVAAGGSCSINVRWSPGVGVGQLEPGSVSISDNGGASPQVLGLIANKLCTPH